MFPVIRDDLLNTNTLIIGGRNCGKTTFLKRAIHLALDAGYRIIVFDSATDHPDKSILVYCKRLFDDCLVVESPEKEEIGRPRGKKPYPYDILKDNKPLAQVCLFDVSRYLEEGFLYEADDPMRNRTRMFYKKLVVQSLDVMYEFIAHRKSVVIMDEIEFIPDFADVISKYNQKGVYFIDCLHTEESCDEGVRNLFDIRRVAEVFPVESGTLCEKDERQLCGPACLHYLLNIVQKRDVAIPDHLEWIADLASFLAALKIGHVLSCYGSSLYGAYLDGSLPPDHPGALSLRHYAETKNQILIKRFTKEDVLHNRLPDLYYIASVQSVFLDKTSPEGSYHYILVHQCMDTLSIICPRRTDYSRMSMQVDDFVRMIDNSGNWILTFNQ